MTDPLSNFVWNANPILLTIGPLSIKWYGLFFALAFVFGLILMNWIFQKEQKPLKDLDGLLIYMMAGTIIGARLGEVLFYNPAYFWKNPEDIIKVWQGGLASHGAAIGILLALYLYSRRRNNQPYLWLLSRISITVALGGFFIRLGNFFNSEIVGVPSTLPWAIIFVRRGESFARHPTMLYESFSYLIIFIILLYIYSKKGADLKSRTLLGTFLVLIFGARFMLEFTKISQAAVKLPLRMGQVLSIPLIIWGFFLLMRRDR